MHRLQNPRRIVHGATESIGLQTIGGSMLRISKKAAYAVLACTFLSTASATVLTFDIVGIAPGVNLPQTYGDNVTAAIMGNFSYGTAQGFTPNVTVSYVANNTPGVTPELQWWSTGYNDLVNIVENEADGDTGYRIVLTAAAGFNVTLQSFDLGNFGSAVTLPGLQVLNSSNTPLLNLSNIAVPADTSPHLSFAGPWTSSTLSIVVNTTGLGGQTDNIGLDNITFSQSAVTAPGIPEPASLLLIGGGLGALIFFRAKSVCRNGRSCTSGSSIPMRGMGPQRQSA
jgi:hypothetical protein